jgi:hypothetical protein
MPAAGDRAVCSREWFNEGQKRGRVCAGSDRVMVRGVAGTGKTTLELEIRRLAEADRRWSPWSESAKEGKYAESGLCLGGYGGSVSER